MAVNMYIVFSVSTLICLANAAILFTLLRGTTHFRTPIKFHLGLTAIFESALAILISLRVGLEAMVGGLEIVPCQIIIGLLGFIATALICTNISISYECFIMMKPDYFYGDARNYTKRLGVIIAFSAILIGLSIYFFTSAKGPPPYECSVLYPAVYNPVGLYNWAIRTPLLMLMNVVLLIAVAYRLNRFNDKRSAKFSGTSMQSGVPHGYPASGRRAKRDGSKGRHNSSAYANGNIRNAQNTPSSTSVYTIHNHTLSHLAAENPHFRDENQLKSRDTHRVRDKHLLSPRMAMDRFGKAYKTWYHHRSPRIHTLANEIKVPAPNTLHVQTLTNQPQVNTPEAGGPYKRTNEKRPSRRRVHPLSNETLLPLATNINNTNLNNKTKNIKRRRLSKNHKASHVIFLLVAACFFLLCYAPYFLAIGLYVFCPNRCGIEASIITNLTTFSIAHGLFSVIVYVVKDKGFRKALVCRNRCRTG